MGLLCHDHAIQSRKETYRDVFGANQRDFFLVSISAKKGATVPVLLSTTDPVQAASYANPLPHVLTLTAIVVGVATLGVGLALCAAIYRKYGSLDEQEILEKIE